MDTETFRSRLLKLLQKSRQAFRLYSSMGKSPAPVEDEHTEMQAVQWRNVNADLVRELSQLMESSHAKDLGGQVAHLRDRYLGEFRAAETDLRTQQKDLLIAVENGDFVRAVKLSRYLVSKKARVQALQAVHHEMNDVLARSRVNSPAILLTNESEKPPFTHDNLARVIPLRRRSAQ